MAYAIPKPNHRRRVPKKFDRGKFSKTTRKRIIERDQGQCRQCGISPAHHIHHVQLKSRGGRGVYSNGMLVCFNCHNKIHQDNSLLRYWQDRFKELYGDSYWKDSYDGQA